MLKLLDGLTAEQVDGVLVKILPSEKSAKRRMSRLESFIFTRSQEDREWMSNYLLSQNADADEEVLDGIERQSTAITLAKLFEFEIYVKNERFWHGAVEKATPEGIERKMMDNQPCRWSACFPQNRNSRKSRKVGGNIYDAVLKKLRDKRQSISAKNIFSEINMLLAWHPEIEDEDRVSECRWNEKEEDWDIVVIKPDGQIIGEPTKTLEDVIKERIIARSKSIGTSGNPIKISDPFLGILLAKTGM